MTTQLFYEYVLNSLSTTTGVPGPVVMGVGVGVGVGQNMVEVKVEGQLYSHMQR